MLIPMRQLDQQIRSTAALRFRYSLCGIPICALVAALSDYVVA